MPDNAEARIVFKDIGTWKNKHLNVKSPVQGLFDVWNPTPSEGNNIERFRGTVAGIQGLIKLAKDESTTLRAYGGAWSLSDTAVTTGYMMNTKALNMRGKLNPESISSTYAGEAESLFVFQCGVSVQEANTYLASRNRALKTTGASNGQSMAGAVSTGTHGAAFGFGSMQDYVVALHLITDEDRHVLVERSTYPVVSDDFIDRLGAERVSDDDIFNSALVGFGSFGVLHAMVVETIPLYLLRMYRFRHELDGTLRSVASTLDFSSLPMPRTEEPYCFQIALNLNDIESGAYVTAMYKDPDGPYEPPVVNDEGYGPGDDLLAFIGQLGDLVPALIPAALKALVGAFYPTPPLGTEGEGKYFKEEGRPGEIFRSTSVRGEGTSMEIGFPFDRASEVIDVLLEAAASKGPVGGMVGIRYVKSSKGTLAFTNHTPITCTVELQGVNSNRNLEVFEEIWSIMDAKDIPYTFHWGQVHNLDAARTRSAYGSTKVDRWIEARKALLGDDVRRVFNNDMIVRCGLDA